jgi:hypothetical protein
MRLHDGLAKTFSMIINSVAGFEEHQMQTVATAGPSLDA